MEKKDEFKFSEAVGFVVVTLFDISLGTSIRVDKESLTS